MLPTFNALPFHSDGSNDREARDSQGNIVRVYQRAVVSVKYLGEIRCSNNLSEFGSSRVDDHLSVEVGCRASQALDQLVGEDVLTNGDKDSTAQRLCKEHQGDTSGDVFAYQDGLGSHTGLLHAESDAETVEELIPDPLRMTCCRRERGNETGSDGHENGAGDHERSVVAKRADKESGHDAADDQRKNHWNIHDTRLDGADAFDSLEPERQIVDQQYQ